MKTSCAAAGSLQVSFAEISDTEKWSLLNFDWTWCELWTVLLDVKQPVVLEKKAFVLFYVIVITPLQHKRHHNKLEEYVLGLKVNQRIRKYLHKPQKMSSSHSGCVLPPHKGSHCSQYFLYWFHDLNWIKLYIESKSHWRKNQPDKEHTAGHKISTPRCHLSSARLWISWLCRDNVW